MLSYPAQSSFPRGLNVETYRKTYECLVRQTHGSQVMLQLGFVVALLILCTNVALLIWTAAQHLPSEKGITTVYTGSCAKIRDVSAYIHLAINVLSSLLLAASNRCMQSLVAPTREEIDRAHAQRQNLEVGVHTWCNFSRLPRLRRVLWTLLAISSVPLHLLYAPSPPFHLIRTYHVRYNSIILEA